MDKITLKDCIEAIVKSGEKYHEKDNSSKGAFKVIVADNEFIYIPEKKQIYLRDLKFDINGGTSNFNNLPLLILGEDNFGKLEVPLFSSLVKFATSYHQMKSLKKNLSINDNQPKKTKI